MSISRKYKEDNMHSSIRRDVDRILADGHTSINPSLVHKLRNNKNLGNEHVDAILESFNERLVYIKKRAIKFANEIVNKSNKDAPLNMLLKRALKYKHKVGFTDNEFNYFKRVLIDTINNSDYYAKDDDNMDYNINNTNIGRALGTYETINYDGIEIDQKDMPHLQEILRQHTITLQLYKNIILQTILYKEYAAEAITGSYDNQKHNINCSIHPVIAALFLPKIDVLQETFILPNLCNIIKLKYEKRKVTNIYEVNLITDLISDPNDIVCDIESPYKDLKYRCILQEKLWLAIMALRSGRYYDCIATQFINAIDNCKLSIADAPDSTYINDEVAILRRLFQAFSFRPITVEIVSSYLVNMTNEIIIPENINFNRGRVTSLPMINVKLPIATSEKEPINLFDQIKKQNYYLENNNLVPKMQNILFTKGIIVFHVARRLYQPIINSYNSAIEIKNFRNILPTLSNFEKCNMNKVDVELVKVLTLSSNINEVYELKSVIAVNTHNSFPDYIIGSRALLRSEKIIAGDTAFIQYNPDFAALKDIDNDTLRTRAPINKLDQVNEEDTGKSFTDIASTYGSVFIYSKKSE
jgi:hypothetical protein